MQCPVCGAQNAEDATYCHQCGTRIEGLPPQPEPPASPPAPTPQLEPPPTPTGAPPRKSRVGLIVVILVVLMLLCIGCGTGGYVFFRGCDGGGSGGISIPEEVTYASAQEAMEYWAKDFYPDQEWSSWVVAETPERVEYFIGLKNSAYDKGIVVESVEDGGWRVTQQYTPSVSEAQKTEDLSIEDVAALVVSVFIKTAAEGDGAGAAELTGPPISEQIAPEDWPSNFDGVVGYEVIESFVDEDLDAVVVRVEEEYDDGFVVHSAYYLKPVDDKLVIVDISVN